MADIDKNSLVEYKVVLRSLRSTDETLGANAKKQHHDHPHTEYLFSSPL